MTEAADHLHDANLPAGRKHDIEQNLALDLELPSFISVNRAGLECDLNRQSLDGEVGRLGLGLRHGNDSGVSEGPLANRAART